MKMAVSTSSGLYLFYGAY